jgi:hypothetical protein
MTNTSNLSWLRETAVTADPSAVVKPDIGRQLAPIFHRFEQKSSEAF